MKFCLGLLSILFMAISSMPTLAQDESWSVYLFSSDTKSLLRVNNDGSEQEYSLGLDDSNVFYINTGVRVSPDGQFAIFCVMNQATQPQIYSLHIRDIEAETTLFELDYETAVACQTGGFNADGTQIAIGLVNAVDSGGIQDAFGGQNIWRVLIVDIATGTIVDEYSSQNPDTPIVTFNDAPVALIPIPEAIESDRVVFRAFPNVGTEFLDIEGFVWDFPTDTVTEFPEIGFFGSDYAPTTGTVAYPTLDENRAYATAMGMIPPYNVVQIQSGVNGDPQELYYNGELAIARVQFINNEEQLLISLLPDMDMMDAGNMMEQAYFALVGLDGSMMEFTVPSGFSSFADSPDGIVVTYRDYSNSAPFVTHFNILQPDGSLVEFAQHQDVGDFAPYWDIVGVVTN